MTTKANGGVLYMEKIKYLSESYAYDGNDYNNPLSKLNAEKAKIDTSHISSFVSSFGIELSYFFDNTFLTDHKRRWSGLDMKDNFVRCNESSLDKPFFVMPRKNIFITDAPDSVSELPSDFGIKLILSYHVDLLKQNTVYTFNEVLGLMDELDSLNEEIVIPFNRYIDGVTLKFCLKHIFNTEGLWGDASSAFTDFELHQKLLHFKNNFIQGSGIRGNYEVIDNVKEMGKLRLYTKYDPISRYNSLHVVSQGHTLYDVIDVGRLVVDGHYLDDTVDDQYLINNKLAIVDCMSTNLPVVVSMKHIKNALRIYGIEEARAKQEAAITEERTSKFNAIKNVLLKDGYMNNPVECTFNEITYNGPVVKYMDLELSSDNDIMETVYSWLDEESVFTYLLDKAITCCEHMVNRGRTPKISFGSKKAGNFRTLLISKKQVGTSAKYYINGTRINKGELVEVIRNSLCFTEDASYAHFLKQISKMSLELHKITNDGLIYSNLLDDQRLPKPCKLIVIREKRKTYIEYLSEGKQQRAQLRRNHKRLINRSHVKWDNVIYESNLVGLLRNSLELTSDCTEEFCKSLVKYGRDLLIEETKQQREALEREIKQLKLERKMVTLENAEHDAVIVKGQTGKQYAIRVADAKVWEYPVMRYICIADTENTTMWGKVLNRVYALKNDSAMASKISTLQRK